MKVTTFTVEEKELPITVALGIASYVPEYCSAFEDVFHAADQAMYVNKEQLKKNKKAAL